MAAHLHTQIRAALVAALTGLPSSGARVFANRLYAIAQTDLPALRVSLDEERVEVGSIHAPVLLERQVVLVVECCALANAGLDAACDQMQMEVEMALAAGLTVAGRVLQPVLTASRYDDEAAAVAAGVKRLEFTLDFATLANAPDVPV